MAKQRAIRNSGEDKLRGKNVLLYINFGEGATEDAPVWALIGGQHKQRAGAKRLANRLYNVDGEF